MKEDKNYLGKIENLINSFSELTDDDIEEAKALLRAEGKDPDQILEKSITRLHKIQKKAAFKSRTGKELIVINYPFPVFLYDRSTSEVMLSTENNGNVLLQSHEVYNTILEKNSLNGEPYNALMFSDEVLKTKFQRLSKEIHFIISIKPEFTEVHPVIHIADALKIDWESVNLIRQTGYYITDGRCYHVDIESLELVFKLFSTLDDNGHLPVYQGINLFANRSEHRLLIFEQQRLDLQQVFASNSFHANSALFIRDLYDYQKEGLQWLLYCVINRTGGILADDMGLGKTAQIIALIAVILERRLLEHILIVVPSTLLENWRREFSFFAPDILPFIHHGSGRIGSPATLKRYPVVITSYSMIINDQFLFDKIQWGITILDEASLIKNPDSERRIALKSLESMVKIAMTGTPVENSLMDLWSIADYVFPGYLGDKTTFASKYINKSIEETLDNGALTPLKDIVSFIMLRRKKDDVLDTLPAKIDIHQAIVMHEGEAVLYEEKRNEIINAANHGTGSNALKLIMDLRMYTTHPLLRKPAELKEATLATLREQSYKFHRMLELLNEISYKREKVLIFTEYLNMIDTLKRILEKSYNIELLTIDGRVANAERQNNIDRFSAKEGFGIMVLNPKTAGMGLNITAANHVIHFTRQWNPALEQQASARAYRNGQKKGVNIYYLYYADTIEEVIDDRLRSKMMLSNEVITETNTENMQEYLEALTKSPVK
jgi:SNF2 family DNA or RNA helicase